MVKQLLKGGVLLMGVSPVRGSRPLEKRLQEKSELHWKAALQRGEKG